jgi:capsular exopolysaccharide synthesis family protein
MTKVFEALERHQKSRNKENGRDLLGAETDLLTGDASNGAGEENVEFVLPAVIGAPVGPRPSEGAVFSSLNVSLPDEAEDVFEDRVKPASRANTRTAYKSEPSAPGMREPALRDRDARPSRAFPKEKEKEPPREKPPQSAPREIPVERIAMPQLHPRLILLTDPDASECEQYRTLRTQLFHAAEKKLTQVVVITSALPGEGKTSTTLNLAFAIAQSKERRVLVVDGDLRRPSIASYLGLYPKNGLGEVLAGAADPLDTIFCLDEYDLYVLPVKRDSSNPTELLSSERLEKMVEDMREYFDFILIDSPPVMPFADTRLLANHTDSIILVVRAGMAPYESVEKSIEALPQGRIMGVVLNSAEHLSAADYYDDYYSDTERSDRRSSFWRKVKKRIGASWFGRRMDLRE